MKSVLGFLLLLSRLLSILTVLGFDFGMRHIGAAVGQVVTSSAQPCANLLAQVGQPNWDQVSNLLKFWQPDALIVGIPINLEGCEHEMTRSARSFRKILQTRYPQLPIFEAEERLTSVEARAQLFAKGGHRSLTKNAVDGLAAKLIVEGWLLQYQRAMQRT